MILRPEERAVGGRRERKRRGVLERGEKGLRVARTEFRWRICMVFLWSCFS